MNHRLWCCYNRSTLFLQILTSPRTITLSGKVVVVEQLVTILCPAWIESFFIIPNPSFWTLRQFPLQVPISILCPSKLLLSVNERRTSCACRLLSCSYMNIIIFLVLSFIINVLLGHRVCNFRVLFLKLIQDDVDTVFGIFYLYLSDSNELHDVTGLVNRQTMAEINCKKGFHLNFIVPDWFVDQDSTEQPHYLKLLGLFPSSSFLNGSL